MTREMRTWDSLIGVHRYSNDLGLLEKHDPYLIWDRQFHGGHTTFFQDAVGRSVARPDGSVYTKDDSDTNMTLGGNIGLPLIFEAREIRFYPADLDQVDRWVSYDWECRVWENGGHVSRVQPLKLYDHLDLPDVDNFTREEGLGLWRVDLQEKAQKLVDHANKNRVPCYVANLKRTFHSLDYLSFVLASDKDVARPVRTYAVMVGAMWIPK